MINITQGSALNWEQIHSSLSPEQCLFPLGSGWDGYLQHTHAPIWQVQLYTTINQRPFNSARMRQGCCNQTPEWTKSCCSSTWQCNLLYGNHLLRSNWKGCCTPKYLCCNSSDYLDQSSWHSPDKTPFELNPLRFQEHDSYYLPHTSTTDHCCAANMLAERLWENFESYCPLSSKIS